MDDVQEAVQIEANLTALPDNPSNEEILQAVKGFRNASVPIAMYRLLEAASGGGGGGGGGASWLGPVKVNAFMAQEIYTAAAVPSGGTYTLTLAGETTTPIDFDASLAALKAALEALPSVGVVTVTSGNDPPSLETGSYIINFGGMGAPEALSADTSGLTGLDAPYTMVIGGAEDQPAELITLATGDVLEDILVVVADPFDTNAKIYFADNVGGSDSPPDWGAVNDPPGGIIVEAASTFNNFLPLLTTGPASLVSQLTNFWIDDGSVSAYRLPMVASDSVTLYGFLTVLPDPPTQGEAWLYVKVGRVTAP